MNKILIIEDDITIHGLLRSIIEKSGYVVDNAYNGTDGLAMGLREDLGGQTANRKHHAGTGIVSPIYSLLQS